VFKSAPEVVIRVATFAAVYGYERVVPSAPLRGILWVSTATTTTPTISVAQRNEEQSLQKPRSIARPEALRHSRAESAQIQGRVAQSQVRVGPSTSRIDQAPTPLQWRCGPSRRSRDSVPVPTQRGALSSCDMCDRRFSRRLGCTDQRTVFDRSDTTPA